MIVGSKIIVIYVFLFVVVFFPLVGYSQRVAITSDALKWATMTPNVGVDMSLSEHVTLNVEAGFNSMEELFSEDLSLKHISISPEVRYWLKRPFYSHYLGVNMLCSSYDLKLGDWVRDGVVVALGVGYGCSFMLSDRWSLVPSVGVGVGYVSYLQQLPTQYTTPKESGIKIVPTRLGVSFTYIID